MVKPFWPPVRALIRALGIKPYGPRQPYLVGYLKEGVTVEAFDKYLLSLGLVDDALAWRDDGEVWSLRRLESFQYQTHIRIFEDGEVRAHHELTPEYDNWGHLTDKDTSEPKKDFMKLIEAWIVPVKNSASE